MQRMKHEHVAQVPPQLPNHPPLQRSENYMEELRKLQPRKYMGHGKHKSYGGPVDRHASEFCFGVTLDPHCDREREILDPGRGEAFDPGMDMASVVLQGRRRGDEGRPTRVKGSLFRGEDGDWMRAMCLANKFSLGREGDDGHTAPGAALGWAGKWPEPVDRAHQRRRNERDAIGAKWAAGVQGADGHIGWRGELI
uniref:Uncharacterized protein n=1 Tax=Hemiselmis tepida TaxID=464990 RepID=A0A7S0Z5X0_9CRYP